MSLCIFNAIFWVTGRAVQFVILKVYHIGLIFISPGINNVLGISNGNSKKNMMYVQEVFIYCVFRSFPPINYSPASKKNME